MKKYKIGFVSLGCSKNLCDTEVMLKILADDGYEITPDETEADIVIINTCAFIESAKKESIDNILDIAWLKENRSLKGIIVCGCLAERYKDELLEEMPEIDVLLGVGSLNRISEAVSSVLEKKEKKTFFDDKETCPLGGDRILTSGDYMAYLKIAEGCSNRCTYCSIPLIRGKMRSRKIEDIVSEAKDLESIGVKEVNIIAQDTSAYGIDIYGKYMLPELLRQILLNTNIPWIRLTYCYPDKISEELVKTIAENDRILNYIDIPVQHISDKILKSMNRHGSSKAIYDSIDLLRRKIPDIVLRTTAIVGFPGETDDDFEQLCRFVKEYEFDRFGAFMYSREEGTPAYVFENQVDMQISQNRYDIIMRTQLEVSNRKNRSRVGKTYDVICEGFDEVSGYYYGRSYAEAPEVDGKIWIESKKKIDDGEFVRVRITGSLDYDLVGKIVR